MKRVPCEFVTAPTGDIFEVGDEVVFIDEVKPAYLARAICIIDEITVSAHNAQIVLTGKIKSFAGKTPKDARYRLNRTIAFDSRLVSPVFSTSEIEKQMNEIRAQYGRKPQ